ncbi:MAG: redoxin domain-containing protein [bacterium]
MRRSAMTAALLALMVLGSGSGLQEGPVAVGADAPDFTLTDVLDGSEVSLSASREDHRYTIVLWIATECPYSNACNDDYQAICDRYGDRGVGVLAINSNSSETADEVARHASEQGFTFPVLDDPGNRVADAYGATFTPELWIVDAGGKTVFHGGLIGPRNDKSVQADFHAAMEALLEGEAPPKESTRAFGCTIKRGM